MARGEGLITDNELHSSVTQELDKIGILEENVNDVVNTKGQPNGIATLDDNAQVPTGQLDNVQYLKDFYGRGVKKIESIDVKTKVMFEKMDLTPILNTKLESMNFVPYEILDSGSNISRYNSITKEGVFNAKLSTTTTSGNIRLALSSQNKIDLTGVDSVVWDFNINSITGQYSRAAVTISDSQFPTDAIGGYSDATTVAQKYTQQSTGAWNATIDTSSLTGSYYILISFCAYTLNNGVVPTIDADLNSIKLNGIGDTLTLPQFEVESLSYSDSDYTLKLTDGYLTGSVDLPQLTIPSQFIDWYNLNSLVTIPTGTSVKFDVYDENDVLLKSDIQQGDILYLSNPIIKPKITLSRDTLETPSPTFSWLEIGYRGSATGMWQKIDEITLDIDTAQLDIDVRGYTEVRILIDQLRAGNASGVLYLKINNIATFNAYRHRIINNTAISVVNDDRVNLDTTYKTDTVAYNSAAEINIIKYKDKIQYTAFKNYDTDMYTVFGRTYQSELESVNIYSNYPILAGAKFEIWGR